MDNDLKRAIEILENGGYTCVLYKDCEVIKSEKTGIKPMMEFIKNGIDLKGYSAADKIVGKAAAMLFTLAGVKNVYGEVMSKKAFEFLTANGITAKYKNITDIIINRKGDDMCPMEKTVLEINNPKEAYYALLETIKKLKAKQ